jgi:uncharacterized protein (UPF0333 family)
MGTIETVVSVVGGLVAFVAVAWVLSRKIGKKGVDDAASAGKRAVKAFKKKAQDIVD